MSNDIGEPPLIPLIAHLHNQTLWPQILHDISDELDVICDPVYSVRVLLSIHKIYTHLLQIVLILDVDHLLDWIVVDPYRIYFPLEILQFHNIQLVQKLGLVFCPELFDVVFGLCEIFIF